MARFTRRDWMMCPLPCSLACSFSSAMEAASLPHDGDRILLGIDDERRGCGAEAVSFRRHLAREIDDDAALLARSIDDVDVEREHEAGRDALRLHLLDLHVRRVERDLQLGVISRVDERRE